MSANKRNAIEGKIIEKEVKLWHHWRDFGEAVLVTVLRVADGRRLSVGPQLPRPGA